MSARPDNEVRSDLQSLARVWALSGPLRGKVAAGVGYKLLQSAFLGLSFANVIWVVSRLAENVPLTTEDIWQVKGLMVLSLAGQILFGFLSVSNSWLASFETAGRLRLSILNHLANLPMRFHLLRHQGDTITALTADMQMIESFMSDALPRIAQAFGLPLIVLAYLIWKDWAVGSGFHCYRTTGLFVVEPPAGSTRDPPPGHASGSRRADDRTCSRHCSHPCV